MSELYRDYIDGKADEIVTALGGTITPAPANAELYRDFLDRKFDDVINAIDNVKVKSFNYTGNGSKTHTIIFPIKPKYVLGIEGVANADNTTQVGPFSHISNVTYGIPLLNSADNTVPVRTVRITNNGDKEFTLDGYTALYSANASNSNYTVYYI